MEHIVLLGDSIFDNASYVSAGADVSSQLRANLGPWHQVSLLARDGDVLADMAGQLPRLGHLDTPATWLFVSCGGNDVLGLLGEMQRPVRSVLEAVTLLATWQAAFQGDYKRMLDLVLAQGKPTAVATIYDSVPGLAPGLRTTLAAFNDVILREAAARRIPVLDLRLVCTDSADYAQSSPIEPSAQGAYKIAAAIGDLVRTHYPTSGHTVVYGAATRALQGRPKT
jgi:lysophospholipase L1-like esterase